MGLVMDQLRLTYLTVEIGLISAKVLMATIGATGGEATHTLTVTEMPSHTHTTTGRYMSIDGGTTLNNYGGGGGYPYRNDINATGSDGAHNNMPPYLVSLPCIKY